jgi:hypothetical protein
MLETRQQFDQSIFTAGLSIDIRLGVNIVEMVTGQLEVAFTNMVGGFQ